MKHIIWIPHIAISNINAHTASWLVSDIPLTAIQGFIHNMSLKCGINVDNFAVLHHTSRYVADTDKFHNTIPHIKSGASAINIIDHAGTSSYNKYKPLAAQPTVETNNLLSLAIITDIVELPKTLNSFLKQGRVGGGQIRSFRSPQLLDSIQDIPNYGGWWLDDATSKIQDEMDNGLTVLEAFISIQHTKSSELTVPASLGYALITEPSMKPGTRLLSNGKQSLHAFCEPIIGLVSFINNKTPTSIPFWTAEWKSDDLFILSTIK